VWSFRLVGGWGAVVLLCVGLLISCRWVVYYVDELLGRGFAFWLIRLFKGFRAACVGSGVEIRGLGGSKFVVWEGRNLWSGRVEI